MSHSRWGAHVSACSGRMPLLVDLMDAGALFALLVAFRVLALSARAAAAGGGRMYKTAYGPLC